MPAASGWEREGCRLRTQNADQRSDLWMAGYPGRRSRLLPRAATRFRRLVWHGRASVVVGSDANIRVLVPMSLCVRFRDPIYVSGATVGMQRAHGHLDACVFRVRVCSNITMRIRNQVVAVRFRDIHLNLHTHHAHGRGCDISRANTNGPPQGFRRCISPAAPRTVRKAHHPEGVSTARRDRILRTLLSPMASPCCISPRAARCMRAVRTPRAAAGAPRDCSRC